MGGQVSGSVAQIRSGVAKNSSAKVTNPLRVHYVRVADVQDGFLDLSDMSEIEIDRADLQRFSVLPGDVLMNEGGDRDKLGRGCIWSGIEPMRTSKSCVCDSLSGDDQSELFDLLDQIECGQTVFHHRWQPDNEFGLHQQNRTRSVTRSVATDEGGAGGHRGGAGRCGCTAGSLTQLIAKKRDLKQAAMQQLLTGRTRLPWVRFWKKL